MRPYSRYTIRAKLTLIVMAITCGSLVIAGAAFISYDVYSFRKASVHDLQTLNRVMASSSTAALAFDDPEAARDVLTQLRYREHVVAACVYDANGKLLAAYTKADGDACEPGLPVLQLDSARFTPNRLIVSQRIIFDGKAIGTATIASDLDELSDTIRWDSEFYGVTLVCLVVGAIFTASRLQRSISEPIRSLALTAKIISAQKDFSVRAERNAGAELGVLIDGFNEMLTEIGRQDHELRHAQDGLEARVKERTAELQQEISVRELTEAALRASDDRTRLLLDSTAEAIYGLDLEGRCTFCNSAVLRILGYNDAGQLLGRNMHATMHHTRADGRPYLESECGITRASRSGVPAHVDDEVLWRADGTSFPAEYWSYPVRRNDVVVGAVVTFFDITERRRSEQALRSATEAAQAASQAKSEFLANMSHEIRTPMNGILGMTELALGTVLDSEQREYLQLVQSSAESLLRIVNDILDFSKIEAGRFDLEIADFDFADFLDQNLKALAVRAQQKGLEFAIRVAPSVPDRLAGDSVRLGQVLVNLVGNAIKFTEKGSIRVEVESEPGTDERYALKFSVSDTGIGIAPEKRAMVFEAFAQADGTTTRLFGGTGLGLTISRRIVEMMGGTIHVESELGKGSTFHFSAGLLPAAAAASVGPIADPRQLEGICVLVADDDQTNRTILDEMLKNWHMRPTLADGGESTLAALRKARDEGRCFPLVLLDAHMPGMDGFAVAGCIQSEPGFAGVTIMMLTSDQQPGDVARCRTLGINVFVVKPVGRSALLRAVLTALGKAVPAGVQSAAVSLGSLAGAIAAGRRKLRLLLAEDNEVNRRLLSRVLEKRGHTVSIAVNGREAVEMLGSRGFDAFDAILMDVQMPELDGLAATAMIRKREKSLGTHVAIVGVTAHAREEDRRRCLEVGMDGYVTKPIRSEELFAEMDRVVAGHISEKKAAATVASVAPEAMVAPEATVAPEAIFDRAGLLERVEGDEDFLAELVRLFLDELPHSLAELDSAAQASDWQGLARAAHKLRGALANLCAPAATAAALNLEDRAKENDAAAARASLAALTSEIGRLTAPMQPRIEEIAR